jgi:hypothetical protein
MSKQTNTKKAPQKQLPKVNDFFTTFLADQVANNKAKLDRIKELKALPKSELSKPQLEKIERKDEVLEKIAELDKVKTLYLVAYQKRAGTQTTAAPAKTEETTAGPDVSQVRN